RHIWLVIWNLDRGDAVRHIEVVGVAEKHLDVRRLITAIYGSSRRSIDRQACRGSVHAMVEDGVRREDRSQESVVSSDREGNGGGSHMVGRVGDLKLDAIRPLAAD